LLYLHSFLISPDSALSLLALEETMHYGGDGRTSKSIYAKEPLLTAETRLWRGVLEQAYADAELPLGVESEDELFIEQIRARRFLRADTPGEKEELRLVCDYAEVPFDRVVPWARKHYTPVARHDMEKVEAKDAREVEEIIKTVKDREALTLALSELPAPLFPLPPLSPLLQ
jgi:hypothetical protein